MTTADKTPRTQMGDNARALALQAYTSGHTKGYAEGHATGRSEASMDRESWYNRGLLIGMFFGAGFSAIIAITFLGLLP